ncbi:MAG: flagellar motor switch protein FliN [Bryobacteraceae bacterium]
MNIPAEIRQWLFAEFSSRLATVFETMAGERPRVEIEPVFEMPPADSALQWRQPFSGVAGAAWIAAAETGWTAIGGHLLRAAGIEENDAAILKSTYLEAISQALAGIATTMGSRLGREAVCALGEESSTAVIDAAWAVLHIQFGNASADITMGLEPLLVMALVASSQPDTSRAEIAEAAPVAGFNGPVNSKTFELLLDVELPVSVSFGRAQVALKDVLKLTTGSIVELNRSIHEPVEIIVNNCVIARGEVVVVEGNFGVRIHQVISRRERLRTLN